MMTLAFHASAAASPEGRSRRSGVVGKTRSGWPLRLLVLPLALSATLPGTAHAASGWAINYFALQGETLTEFWDIDNQGRIAGSATRGFLLEAGQVLSLKAADGTRIDPIAFSETGLIAGNRDSRIRDQDVNTIVQMGIVGRLDGSWRPIEVPGIGITSSLLRAISPNGRYVAGSYYTPSSGGSYLFDLETGQYSLTPLDGGLMLPTVVDNQGHLLGYASSTSTTRAVNSAGLMAGSVGTITYTGMPLSAWVGNADGISRVPTKAGFSEAAGLNDLGQVVGRWTAADLSRSEGFVATPVALPEPSGTTGEFRFVLDVRADVPVFIDPEVAVGYHYAVGQGDPMFKTVSLPLGVGDGQYTLSVGGLTLSVAANQIVDFTALGFADGVAGFTVTGIETSAMLDPSDANAFVTRLTFASDGRFTGTQTALTAQVPEPTALALWTAGMLALLGWRRRPALRPRGTS